jgi:hypothetical protein
MVDLISQHGGELTIKNSFVQKSATNCHLAGGLWTAEGVNLELAADSGELSCPGFELIPFGHNTITILWLDDNGGPTETIALNPSGPAVDVVDDCTNIAGDSVTMDQRGLPRTFNSGGCDVGAFEHEEPAPPPPPAPAPTTLTTPQNTTCRHGPDMRYAAAAYLLAGESAPVLGTSEDGQWLAIAYGDGEQICFLARALVEVDGPLDGLQTFSAPPLPPTDTPEPLKCTSSVSQSACIEAGGTWVPPSGVTAGYCDCP